MPLIVKDYKWKQTEELITIQVPLKGVPSSNVDIFTSDNYIKANYPPFLFEVFLRATIDETASKCTLSDEEIIFELHKTIPSMWEDLHADISKMEMLEKRREIFEKHHKKTEEERKARKEKMAGLKRFAVQQQIERDTINRHTIEERRNKERSKAMNELEDWKTNEMEEELRKAKMDEADTPSVTETLVDKEIFTDVAEMEDAGVQVSLISSECSLSKATDRDHHRSNDLNSVNMYNHSLSDIEEEDGKCTTELLVPVKNSPAVMREKCSSNIFPIPLPRNPGTVTIHFTHRDFPTPSRESQAPQEEEWLKKQVEARRATGFVAEDLRPEECNPSWLKDKGDSFYKTGNFLGAVSAYSHAIKLGSKMASLYSNRAAAHLGLGNFHKALDDCSQALDLMTPHVAANVEGRAKSHARRGAILCRLGLPEAGLADFEEALKLKPNDSKLIADIDHARLLIKNKADEEERFDGTQIVPS